MSRAPLPNSTIGFTYEGEDYSLVFKMKAIAFFERQADVPISEALAELEEAQRAGRDPKVSHLVFLVHAGLREHHRMIDEDTVIAMINDPAVMAALGNGLGEAMPQGAPGDAEPEDDPEDTVGNGGKDGTGKTSKSKPPKRASRRKTSGS